MSGTRERQKGNILFPVALIGLTLSLSLGALMNHSLVLEQVAVENRLAEIRSYWGIMGHYRYALSRIKHTGFCTSYFLGICTTGNLKDTDRVTILQNYLNEISSYRTWNYPEENAGYSIKIDLTAAVDDNPSRQTYSGHLMVTSSYPTSGVSTLGILHNLPNRFMPLQLRICTGLSQYNSTCPSITNNNGGNATGYYSVKRLYRRNSVS